MYADEKPTIMSTALLGWYGVVVSHNVKEIVQHEREITREEDDDIK